MSRDTGTELRLAQVMHNMRNASGDQRFDLYDWVPLLAVLFATVLILSGLFPNRFSGKQDWKT